MMSKKVQKIVQKGVEQAIARAGQAKTRTGRARTGTGTETGRTMMSPRGSVLRWTALAVASVALPMAALAQTVTVPGNMNVTADADGVTLAWPAPVTGTDSMGNPVTPTCAASPPISGNDYISGATFPALAATATMPALYSITCSVTEAGVTVVAGSFTVTVYQETSITLDSVTASVTAGGMVRYTGSVSPNTATGTVRIGGTELHDFGTCSAVPVTGSYDFMCPVPASASGTYAVFARFIPDVGSPYRDSSSSFRIVTVTAGGTPPVITVPDDMSVTADAVGMTLSWSAITGTDSMGNTVTPTCTSSPPISGTNDYISGATFPAPAASATMPAVYTITCTATDTDSNTGMNSFTVTVYRRTSITLSATASVTAGEMVRYTGTVTPNTATGTVEIFGSSGLHDDTCSAVSVTGSYEFMCPVLASASGAYPVNATFSPNPGSAYAASASPSISVTVTAGSPDTEAPVITAPGNQTVTLDSTGAGGDATWTAVSATDNVDAVVTPSCAVPPGATGVTPRMGDSGYLTGAVFTRAGAYIFTCTATDEAGNDAIAATFIASVTQQTSITLDAVTASVTAGEMVRYTGSVLPNTATGTVEITSAGLHDAGTCPAASVTGSYDFMCPVLASASGANTVIAAFTPNPGSAYRGSSSAPISVTVTASGTRLMITVPPDQTATVGVPATWTVPSVTGGSGTVSVACEPQGAPTGISSSDYRIGATFTAAGFYTITCTATDSSSPANTATDSFTVTATDGGTGLTITVPPDQTATVEVPATWPSSSATGGSGTVSTSCSQTAGLGTSTSNDGYTTGATFPAAGSYTITCTATDSSSPPDTATDTFTVTVTASGTDTEAPVITVPVNQTVTLDSTGAGGDATWTAVSATDNVDTVITPSCAVPPGTTGVAPLPSDPAYLTGARFTSPGSYTFTCTATDMAGNVGMNSFSATVTQGTSTTLSFNQLSVAQSQTVTGTVIVTPQAATGMLGFAGFGGLGSVLPCALSNISVTATATQYPFSCAVPQTQTTGEYGVQVSFVPAVGDYIFSSSSVTLTVTARGTGLMITVPPDQTATVGIPATWIGGSIFATGGSGTLDTRCSQTVGPGMSTPATGYLTGATFPAAGVYTITCTATDDSNNMATDSFTVTVNVNRASVTVPLGAPLTATIPEGSASVVVSWIVDAVGSDGLSATPSCFQTGPTATGIDGFRTGAVFTVAEVYTFICEVREGSATVATGTFTVTINQGTTTTLDSVTASVVAGEMVTLRGTVLPVGATGIVSFSPQNILTQACDAIIGSLVSGSFVTTCAIPPDATPGSYDVTANFVSTGDIVYVSSSSVDMRTLRVVLNQDTIPPVVTVPPDALVVRLSSGVASATWTVSATDNSGVPPTISCEQTDGPGTSTPTDGYRTGAIFTQTGTYIITCTATDSSSNPGMGSITVTVEGQTPTITLSKAAGDVAQNQDVTVSGTVTPAGVEGTLRIFLVLGQAGSPTQLPCAGMYDTQSGSYNNLTCTVPNDAAPNSDYRLFANFTPFSTALYATGISPQTAPFGVTPSNLQTTTTVLNWERDTHESVVQGGTLLLGGTVMATPVGSPVTGRVSFSTLLGGTLLPCDPAPTSQSITISATATSASFMTTCTIPSNADTTTMYSVRANFIPDAASSMTHAKSSSMARQFMVTTNTAGTTTTSVSVSPAMAAQGGSVIVLGSVIPPEAIGRIAVTSGALSCPASQNLTATTSAYVLTCTVPPDTLPVGVTSQEYPVRVDFTPTDQTAFASSSASTTLTVTGGTVQPPVTQAGIAISNLNTPPVSVTDTMLSFTVRVTADGASSIPGTIAYSLQRISGQMPGDADISLGSRAYVGGSMSHTLPRPEAVTAGQWRLIARFTPDNPIDYAPSENRFVLSVGAEAVTLGHGVPQEATVGQAFTVTPTVTVGSGDAATTPAGTLRVMAISDGRTVVDNTQTLTAGQTVQAIQIAAVNVGTSAITFTVSFTPTDTGRYAAAGVVQTVIPIQGNIIPVSLGVSGTLTVGALGALTVSATANNADVNAGTVTVSVAGVSLPGLPQRIDLSPSSPRAFSVTPTQAGFARIVLTYAGGLCATPGQTPCQQTYAPARTEVVIPVQNSAATVSTVLVGISPLVGNSFVVGRSVRLAATVEAPAGTPTTAGMVQFYFDGEALGDPVTTASGQNSYQAIVPGARMITGTHTYSAEFIPTDPTSIGYGMSGRRTISVSGTAAPVIPILTLGRADGLAGIPAGIVGGGTVLITAIATAPTGELLDGSLSLNSDLFMSPSIVGVFAGLRTIAVNAPAVAGVYMVEATFAPSDVQYGEATAMIMIDFAAERVRTSVVLAVRSDGAVVDAGSLVTAGNPVTVNATVSATNGDSVDGQGSVRFVLTSTDGSARALAQSISTGGVYTVDLGDLSEGVYALSAAWETPSQLYLGSESESRTLRVVVSGYVASASCGPFDWVEDGNGLSQTYIRITGHAGATEVAVTLDNTSQTITGEARQVLSSSASYGIDLAAPASLFNVRRIENIYGAFGRGDVTLHFTGVEQSTLDCDRLTRSSPVQALTGFGNRGGGSRNIGDGDR